MGERVIDQGVLPHCISTDLTVPGRARTVHSMTEMMTRFLAMGFTFDQVVTMCSENPAKAVGIDDRIGTLHAGKQADLSVLDIQDGDWVVYDVLGDSRKSDRAVTPVMSVKKGQVFEAAWGPRPWGWEPDSGLRELQESHPVVYPVIEILPECAPQTEEMGSKSKFWYLQQGDTESYWLFKCPRPGRGEHWAEKIAAEVAGLLEIPCARVELAMFQGAQGSATESLTGHNRVLIHGNEVLSRALPDYDSRERNFHSVDHTLENIHLALDRTFEDANDANDAKGQLAQYLVLDALIGNTDRHSENWGTLLSEDADRGVRVICLRHMTMAHRWAESLWTSDENGC